MTQQDQWWRNVPELIKRTDEYYQKAATKFPGTTKLAVTAKKIVEARGWQPSLHRIEKNFDRVLTELNVFYVPKTFAPGPLFVFPILDITGEYPRAQTKPQEGSVLWGQGSYHWIGEKVTGPNWLGNDPATLARIIETREAWLVEGPFDLIAARLLEPDKPIMSPLTKSISDKHEAYLRMLGVDTLNLMFDNERPDKDKGKDLGGGNLSMEVLKHKIKTMKVVAKWLAGGNDPSAALQTSSGLQQLSGLFMGGL